MKRYGILVLLIVSVSVMPLFCQSVQQKAYDLMLQRLLPNKAPTVDVQQADSMQGRAIFLDARSREEYEVSHIQNAQWIGYEAFEPKAVQNLPRDDEIIVYCSVGYRSDLIADRLQELGFSNVKNLYGGIFEWVNRDKPVYRGATRTDSVHAYNKKWGIWLRKGEKVYE